MYFKCLQLDLEIKRLVRIHDEKVSKIHNRLTRIYQDTKVLALKKEKKNEGFKRVHCLINTLLQHKCNSITVNSRLKFGTHGINFIPKHMSVLLSVDNHKRIYFKFMISFTFFT